jgi:hypothetical protein
MIQSRTLDVGGFEPPYTTLLTHVSDVRRPHRLAAQDEALSRLKQGFESPWGHTPVAPAGVTVTGDFF